MCCLTTRCLGRRARYPLDLAPGHPEYEREPERGKNRPRELRGASRARERRVILNPRLAGEDETQDEHLRHHDRRGAREEKYGFQHAGNLTCPVGERHPSARVIVSHEILSSRLWPLPPFFPYYHDP